MATIAPPKAKATYYNIPPPPLPEFYLPKAPSKGNNDGSSTSSASVDHAQALAQTKIKVRRRSKQKITETYLQEPTTHDYDAALAKLPPDPGDGTDERMRVRYTVERTTSRPIVTFAPPPPPLNTNDVPPLAIYHVCRICLRPRSTRYHCEHPIPINGVPPPPTICRRCRVSTVKEVAKVATVIQESESNKMKLGIGAFIPQEDYVSNKEMKERRARELLRSVERQRLRESSASESTGQEREIAFRRVRVLESVSDSPPRLQTSVKSTAQDAIDAVSVRSQGGRTTIAVAATSRPVGPSSEKTFSVSARPSEGRANDSGFQEVGEGVISTEPPRDIDKTKQKTKITAYTASSIAHAPSTAVARASVSIAQPARPERSESEIRRIAREEIVRYRQAERKMEAHPDPYAHGRMVPVERRIEKQADVIEPMPWARRSEAVEEVVLTRRQKNAKETPTQPAKSSKEDTAKEMAQPRPERVAPRRDEGSKKAPADAELSEPVRPEQGSARIKPDKSVEREYVIERVSKGDSKVSASGWTSGSGWVSEKKDEPGRQSQPSKTTTAKLRSERSERRKWDVMTETPTQQEPSSQTTRSAQDGSRSARSERRKWDLLTESGKTTTEPRSDRVPNVKQHEVPSWEDERGGYIRREIWLPSTGDYEVINVIEETEKPREMRSSGNGHSGFRRRSPTPDEDAMPNRILEIRSEAESNRSRPSRPPHQETWSRPTNRDDQSNEGAATVRSSKYDVVGEIRYRNEDARSQTVRGPPSLSDCGGRMPQSGRASDRRAVDEAPAKLSEGKTKATKPNHPDGRRAAPEEEEKPSETARPRAYDLRWAAVTAAAAAAAGIGAGSQQRQHKEPGNAVEDDHAESDESSDKTRWPEQPASKPDSRAGRSDAGTERTTKFSEAPVSERSSRPARSPEREYIFTERIVEPAGRQWERERSRDVPGRRYVETRELFSTSKGSRAGSSSGSTAGPHNDREEGSQASTQCRSQPTSHTTTAQPTSQPSRNYRAIYREVKAGDDSEHSSGRVRFASKVDVSPTPPDSEASSTQFRMIGARPGSRRKVVAEGGERERGEDLIVEYEERRGRSRARDRARSGGVGEGQKQEYFYERKGVESSRSRCDGAEDPSERSGGGSPEKREPKPLARAFSESPSRELHSEAPAWANEDGFRPYRPEMLRPNSRDIDSLEVGSGSGHGEDRGVKHSAHGRWQEDLPVLEGYGW